MAANAGPLLHATTRQEAMTWSIAQVIARRDAIQAELVVQKREGCKLCTANAYNNKIAMLNGVIRRKEKEAAAS